jgi:cephalosporin hydroxylase
VSLEFLGNRQLGTAAVETKAPSGDPAERAVRRYLNLLRDALLNEHYLENELRIEHLLNCVTKGEDVNFAWLANPVRNMATLLRRRQQERHAGELPSDRASATRGSDGLAYAGVGRFRLDHLERCLEVIRDEGVEGDLVESGTGRGGAAIFMCGFLEACEMPDRRVWVADRFESSGSSGTDGSFRFAHDFNTVRDGFARFGLLDDRVAFLQGPPSQTLAEASIGDLALLRVNSQDPDEMGAVLGTLYERVAPGGFVVVDGYGAADCEAAVDEFRSARGIVEPLHRIDWSAAAWRKRTDGTTEKAVAQRALRGGPVQRGRTATKDLAVVVVVHNMRREARRTLHSLSRSYQSGIDDLEYEVIVVENGSDPEQRLGEELVRGFGPEFRYIDLGEDASPSPAGAINRGIAASTARNLALMIDGAHLLTPGVLHYGMFGLTTYPPAVVIAKHWYLGPGQQPVTAAGGYDEELEDQLFAEIDWPTDGYRLFEIGHFIGKRDWFDGDWESNCIFVPRALVEQVGGMDERFASPGGGFVNLDFYERMVCSPGINLVTMLGEASFHQFHGGTTTNVAEPDELVSSYEDEYAELRGCRFYVPLHDARYVGRLPPAARRIRPRRMSSLQRFHDANVKMTANRPFRPAPVPQDLKAEFIEAVWRSGQWHRTKWLGRSTHRAPTDLFAYQELICRVRPEWIVETRTGAGGQALFLASICDLIDHGQVLSIDSYPLGNPPEHSRITYLRGDPTADDVAAQVRDIVGEPPRSLVILGGAAAPQVFDAFLNYAPLVPVGSYVVVEDTILEGNPVWPGFGSGPAVAAQQIIAARDFAADPWFERFGLTFNVGGFLKRVR